MSKLPAGWVEAGLLHLCSARMGPTILTKDLTAFGVPVYSAGQVNNAWGHTNMEVPTFGRGTVVVSARGSIGFAKIPAEELFTCTQTTIALTPVSGVHPAYIRDHLRSIDLASFGSGAAIPMLTISHLRGVSVPLAPSQEQLRIADKIEALTTRMEACGSRLDRVPLILKRFRESVLEAAVSGRLTEEWRKQSGHLNSWEDVSVGEIATVVRGASPRPAGDSRYFGGDIPWITVGELTKDENKYLRSVTTFLTSEGRERSRFVERGTLLLSNSGATLGVPKIIDVAGCINDGSVALLGVEEPLKSYLYYVLRSKTMWLRGLNQGAAQPNLNTTIVREIRFGLPPSDAEQSEIVRRVEELFVFADDLERQYRGASERVEKLTPAVLAKAFRGELVPQDPSDEPAEKLLERIRAERDTNGSGARRGRSKRPQGKKGLRGKKNEGEEE